MNVACPSCSTRYSVDDARIPPSGVTIKCPKCQHVFVAKKDASPSSRGSSAVALPGNAAPGSRGSPVPLPGKSGPSARTQAPAPSAKSPAPQSDGGGDGELDLGLDEPAPKAAPKPAAPPPAAKAPPKPAAPPPASKSKQAGEALDFIDDTANRAGVKGGGSGGSNEYRVRRRNGRIEGPFGVGRIVTMLKNKEFTGGEDISEDGISWRSMTSNPQFNQVLNDLANADDALAFGNVDLASDLPVPRGAAPKAAPAKAGAPPPKNAGGNLELSSPLDGLSGGGASGKHPASGDFDLGLEDERDGPSSLPPMGAPKPSVPYGPGIAGDADSLDLDRPSGDHHEAPPAPKKGAPRGGSKSDAPADGVPPSGAAPGGPDALEVGEIPELPPIWQTYRKPIIAFVGVVALFLVGFFTHIGTRCGAYGIKCLASLFEPPPPPPPQKPPPPPAKVADQKEIATLIDEGSYEAFRSVLATIEALGPKLPDNMLAAAKARGFATLAYGAQTFPLADLSKAVEALNTVDLAKAAGGNAAAANLEILKARAALEILNSAQDSAANQLATALDQRGDDKEIAYLLGLARLRQGDAKSALEAFDKSIVSDPNFAPALHAIGDVVLGTGDEKSAATWYLKALSVQPSHSRSAVAAAALYKKLNMFGERRRTLAMAGDKVARGLPPDQRAPFLYEAAMAFEEADRTGEGLAFAQEAARLDPANAKYVSLAAVAMASSGTPQPALQLLDPLIQREPTNVDALLSRARVYIRMDNVAKAFIDLEAVKKLAPKDPRIPLWEARFDLDFQKLNDARDALNRAVKLDSAGPVAFVDLGKIDLTVGDVDAAFKNASEAVKRDPNNAPAHALLGDCLLFRDEIEKAIASYQRALELDDENIAANLGYANALRDTSSKGGKKLKVAEAIPIYLRLLASHPKNPTIMFEYGRALEIENDVTGALELYREAAALDEKDVRPHLKMAAAYIEKQDPDLAAASKSIAAARRIEAGGGRVNGHVRFWEGRLAILEKRVHDGEAALRTAVEAEPRNAVFHYWLGRALEENNSLYEAIGYYEKAVSLNSRLAVADRALGRTAMERNQFEKAREWFDKYREAAPDDTSVWVDIGESFQRQNREDDALEAFNKAAKFDPKNAHALLAIGDILFDKGQETEAARYFERAVKADPTLGDAWCQYGQSLARVKVTHEAREALEKCVKIANSSEDLRTNAKETLETGGTEGLKPDRKRRRR